MRILRSISMLALIGFVLAITGPTPAAASTKRLRPLDFVPTLFSAGATRSPVAIGAGAFSAPLNLPPGARITGIRLFSSGAGWNRGAYVYRQNMSVFQECAAVGSTENSPSPTTPTVTTGELNPDASRQLIDSSFLYHVEVLSDPETAVWAVDIDYTR